MTNEFKKINDGNEVRYVLEDGGSTTTGAVATVEKPLGELQRRVEPPKPRNFVAKNAKMGGAGQHKDKKKSEKQGDVKHKKPFMENSHPDEKEDKALIRQMVKRDALKKENYGMGGYETAMGSKIQPGQGPNMEGDGDVEQELGMAGSELYGIAKHAKELLALIHQQGQEHGLEAWQQSKITKAADYLTAVLQSLDYDTNVEQGVEEGSLSELTDKLVNRVANRRSDNEIDARDNLDHNDPRTIAALQRSRANKIRSNYLNTTRDANKLANTASADPLKVAAARRDAEYRKYKAKETPIGGWEKMQGMAEEWSKKYKSSINCSHPKGFSQKAHCAGKKKHNESMMTMEMTCPDCGMCKTHGNLSEIKKGAKDSNGFTKCWPGHHAAGTKKGKNGGQVRNCVPNEDIAEDPYFTMLERSVSQAQHNLMVGVAHNPQFAQQVKVKQSVGKEFADADKGHDIKALPVRVPKKK